MLLLVRYNGIDGAVVGYAPGPKGVPLAVVVSNSKLVYAKLEELELLQVPRKLARREAKAKRLSRKANGHSEVAESPDAT
jgi:hypothetical protein